MKTHSFIVCPHTRTYNYPLGAADLGTAKILRGGRAVDRHRVPRPDSILIDFKVAATVSRKKNSRL